MYKIHLFNTQSEQDAIYYSALTPTSESIIKKDDKVFDETVYFEWDGNEGHTVTSAGTMFEIDSDTFVEGNYYCVDFNGESVFCRAVDDGGLCLKTEDNEEVGGVYMDDVLYFVIWFWAESNCYFSGMTSANTPSTLPLVIYDAEVDISKVYTKPWVSMVRENGIVTFNKPKVWLSITITGWEMPTYVFPNIKKIGTPDATVEIYSYEIGGQYCNELNVVGAEGCRVDNVDFSTSSMTLSLSNITDNVMITFEIGLS